VRIYVETNNGIVADAEGSGQMRADRTFTVTTGVPESLAITLGQGVRQTDGSYQFSLSGINSYNFVINWGDGQTQSLSACASGLLCGMAPWITHTFPAIDTARVYTITVTATSPVNNATGTASVSVTVPASVVIQTNALPVLSASATRPSTNSVRLTWTRDTSSTMADNGYVVYRKTTDSITDTSTGGYHLGAGTTTFIDDGAYTNNGYYSSSGFIPSGVPVPNQTYYYWIYAKGPNNTNNSGPVKVVVSGVADPVLNFSSSVASVVAGNATTLTWSSTGISTSGTPCFATGPSGSSEWLGAKASSGTATVTVPSGTTAGTRIYALSCTSDNGVNVGKTLNIEVTAPAVSSTPTISFSSPNMAVAGQIQTASWTTTGTVTGRTYYVYLRYKTVAQSDWVYVGQAITPATSRTWTAPSTSGNYILKLELIDSSTGTTIPVATAELPITVSTTSTSGQSQMASSLAAIRALLETMKAGLTQ